MDLDVSFNTYTCKYHEVVLTHFYSEQQQKHDKMTNDSFSERLIEKKTKVGYKRTIYQSNDVVLEIPIGKCHYYLLNNE